MSDDDDKVVGFRPKNGKIGDGLRVNPDNVLEGAKGASQVVTVHVDKDGNIKCASSEGRAQAIYLMTMAIHKLSYSAWYALEHGEEPDA